MYADLVRRYKGQPSREVFAHFSYKGQDGESWETPYERLARMAKPEDWNFKRLEFRRDGSSFPILTSYLNYTFLRIQQLDAVSFSEDGSRSCFNTGLQTPNEKDIFATFYRNKYAGERDQPDWILYGFFDSYSEKLADFRPLPDVAEYVSDPSDLVFDTTYDFEINFDHIFDHNSDRLPDPLKTNKTLAISAIQGSIHHLKQKIKRNYKVAIPHWYEDKIQLLLPLNLMSENESDLALVADKDKRGKIYRIKTVLTMDMAYVDARLITRPDQDWLNP